MGHPLRKDGRLIISERNKTQIAKSRTCHTNNYPETDQHLIQVSSAVSLVFIRYEKAFEKLSNV